MPLTTTDPTDPRLGHGSGDDKPSPQNEAYLVLSKEERAKGFVRPVRRSYKHVGASIKNPLRDLTEEENARFPHGYVKFEVYPESESPKTGRFWTQEELDSIGKGCGAVTTMGQSIAETYARSPHFYGATYCAHCQMHRPVSEFVWDDDGTIVGS
jgi:hypothetical protein